MFQATPIKRILFFLIGDIFLYALSLFIAYNLRFNFAIPNYIIKNFLPVFLILLIIKISFLSYFKLYNVAWRFFSLNESKKIALSHFLTLILFFIIFYTFSNFFYPFPRSVLIIDFILSTLFITFFRFSKRIILESGENKTLQKTILIGVSNYTQTIIKNNQEYYIVAIFDDIGSIIGSYFSGFKVEDLKNLEKILQRHTIHSAIVTKNFSKEKLVHIQNLLNKHSINDIKILVPKDDKTDLKKISIEDLLARKPKDLDKEAIKDFIKDKVIMITGAGGSIGSELCKQCIKYGAKKLILIDHSEFNLYQITEELDNKKIKPYLLSVLDKELLDKCFSQTKPDIVLHAAAYKHVPLVEENIEEGIRNNVLGTKNCIDLSIKHRVKKFVLVSTDKAVRPTNVMGATKRVCELYAQNIPSQDTEIVAVRFGNVLGSSGSVIPKFKKQIKNGGPVTVTHPEITRYFMLIPEACQLVLQAASIGEGGELFILDMGEPVKIVDLARKMCQLSGKDDIEIVFTGLRAGEKLYEELLIDNADAKTQYESIMIAKSSQYDIHKLDKDIDELLKCEDKLKKLKEIVPEFKHQKNIKKG